MSSQVRHARRAMAHTGRSEWDLIPSTGVVRKLRALGCLGYSGPFLGQQAHVTPQYIHQLRNGEYRHVRVMTDRWVHNLWLEYSETPAPPRAGGAARVRHAARRHQWLPVEAWDGVDIDDPAAVPWAADATVKYGNFERSGKTNASDVDPDVNAADALFYRRIRWDQTSPIDREYAVWQLHEHWSVGEIAQAIGVNQRRVSRALRAARERWQNNNDQTAA